MLWPHEDVVMPWGHWGHLLKYPISPPMWNRWKSPFYWPVWNLNVITVIFSLMCFQENVWLRPDSSDAYEKKCKSKYWQFVRKTSSWRKRKTKLLIIKSRLGKLSRFLICMEMFGACARNGEAERKRSKWINIATKINYGKFCANTNTKSFNCVICSVYLDYSSLDCVLHG